MKKVIIKSKIRKGEIGTLAGTEKTAIGVLHKVVFDNGQSGLYSEKDFAEVVEKKQTKSVIKQLDAHADKVLAKRAKKETRVRKDKTGVQYNLDLRQDVAWENYVDPRSATFNNAYQSAIKAGYSTSTAKSITMEEWWQKRVEHLMKMLPRAEEVIFEDLNLDTHTTITIGGGKKGKKKKAKKGKKSDDFDDDEDFDDEEESEGADVQTVSIINPKLRRIRQEASFFVAETLGRKRYHKKVEMETNNNISLVDGNEVLDNLFRKNKKK